MKNDKTIKLAVIGLDSAFFPDQWVLWSKICQYYPWINPAFPKVEIVAASTAGVPDKEIVSNSGISAEQFSAKHNVALYTNSEEMLDKEKPNGVFVCGRPSRLKGLTLEAIRRGVHVFVQKPGAANSAELAELAEEAESHKVAAAVGQTWRFDHPVSVSRQQMETADIGKLCSLRVMYNHGMPRGENWYFDQGEGGPELWLGWYPIDLLHYFTGSKITRVFATAHRGDGSAKHENAIVHASCEFASGVKGSFDFYGNINYPYARAEWELLGEHGMIRNLQRHDVEVYQLGKPQQAMYRNVFTDCLAYDISEWLQSWNTDTTKGLTLKGAVETVRVAEAVRESFTTGRAVDLSP